MTRPANFLILGLFLLGLSPAFTLKTDQIVKRKTKTGEIVEVEIVKEGRINLYFQEVEGDILPFEEAYSPYQRYKTLYYVGQANSWIVEEINERNYRFRLRAYTKDRPAISQKIGSRGYRFSDIPDIIEAYNQDKQASNKRR